MSLEITGSLLKILPEQGGVSKNGNWVKQEFILETEEQYPKKVCITAWGEKVDELKKLKPGERLKVSINIESREYNERWYTDVRAWRIDKAGADSAQSSGSNVPQFDERDYAQASSSVSEADDLPF